MCLFIIIHYFTLYDGSYEGGTFLHWDSDTITTLCFDRYPAMLESGVMKGILCYQVCPGVASCIMILNKINHYILSTWQVHYNDAVSNKFHSVKPVLGDWQTSNKQCRTRIGHTQLTHSYILKNDYLCILTVHHIFVECNHFAQERKYIFGRRDVDLNYYTPH